ncbi:ADP-ribosylating toxin [Pseudomonas sp. DTU_2021_1001937_2_SI_NGA_ILE_001]|uniref:dermonecrotic toxin domain-containing protein n=1 Tax=Pseudomonas sp. DTU_2021_1001937_2_SI_NGA_ILE_001 TaxID=3077589 RepID=UPI0028FC243D|nr:DUF6543 domain-containing protein [Pseudomonas sp. DTU_2021_1001937_2_SI_NGA_ILE_001]WNW13042.1 ADP-ribosylating toxin [Pseudomonas sp. DTU_2021_1001937_2_SI_NGA_ILE_001]
MPHSAEFIAGAQQRVYQSEQRLLRQKARQFIQDYPDVHGLAWALARKLLQELAGSQADPDKVWWHRFATAVSSSRTYNGWAHTGTPVESMTLVELVMHRFNARDQDASDELQMYGGFYIEGPGHGHFDERNEVRLLPQQVMARLWQLDFAQAFGQRVEAFWSAHAQTFLTLARTGCKAAAALAVRNGQLTAADLALFDQAISAAPTVSANATAGVALTSSSAVSVRSFDIGGLESSHVIRVVDGGGRQILYVAGSEAAFHVFATEGELFGWVQGCLHDEAARKAFSALFLSAADATPERAQALAGMLERIRDAASGPDTNQIADPEARVLLNQTDRVILGDVFEHWRDLARREMHGVVHALTSNASLRKQMWIGSLNAVVRVFGPLAVLSWPLALSLIGAGLANVGLNIDQAVNGVDARQRKAGVIGAVFNAIYVLFSLPLLADALPVARAALVPGPASAPASSDGEWVALQSLGASGSGDVPMQGIERTASGETWIMLGETPRRVRFSSSLNTWLAVDPLNPFAFEGATPVRLDAQGQWQALPSLKLGGGMEGASGSPLAGPSQATGYPTVSSEFWDVHMRFDLEEEERLSDLALARQKAVINVHEMAPEDQLSVDSAGDQVVIDAWGNEFRVFKTPAGRYYGGRVNRYSQREEEFNQYLRTGKPRITNQVEMIEELADDLRAIGYDNHATLYRGGSGARGTSGLNFRQGHIKAGDVLVNTDFTSFSENPYVTRSFASSQAGAPSYGFDGAITFDDSSIVFEILAEQYLNATPVAPFSEEEEEAELLFAPGHYFQVRDIHEVRGTAYRFIRVRMQEIAAPSSEARLFELRTGEPFSREQYAARLGEQGKRLVERFFPRAQRPSTRSGQE